MPKHLKIFRRLTMAVLTVVVAAGLSVANFGNADSAGAAGFDPANIISDARFFDKNSMSEAQIQTFLEGRMPSCRASAGSPACLRDYRADSFSRAAQGSGHCAAYQGEAGERASRIIYKVAQACGISPQVLLVTLQKEQSLVTDNQPAERQYRVAMGFGCPDTAPCDAQYFGFYNQVYKAAWQFRQYTLKPSQWRYRVGNTAVQFHPNAACGSTVVNIQNQATANLYNYTPYQPNAAALAAGWGTGDSCSAYGNRNFWNYLTSWFGAPTTDGVSPVGNFEAAVATINTVRVTGWTLDPERSEAIDVHVYVDDVVVGAYRANTPRSDVGAAFPGKGNNHGFDATIAVAPGPHRVCVFAYNVGAGSNTLLDCKTVSPPGGSPYGNLEGIRVEGATANVSGWTIDPDTQNAVELHVYVNGGWGGSLVADRSRTDVGGLNPGYGDRHGFDGGIPLGNGNNEVCVFAINVGVGTNTVLGCRTVTGPVGGPPVGTFEQIKPLNGTAEVTGWTLDPDSASPIDIHVYVNGVGAGAFRANQARSDVAAAYPAYGPNHGFKATFAVPPGISNVCVFAINTGAGTNQVLGCRDVSGATGPPYGNFEAVSLTDGKAKVSGWAIDPDTASPIDLHVYANGRFAGVVTAGLARPDVGGLNRGYGDKHGFSELVSVPAGASEVCVFAINVGGGNSNPLLGCKTVEWGAGSPTGNYEGLSIVGDALRLSGWSIDPDSPAPVDIHVYVNGSWGGLLRADQSRPDVGAVYPKFGAQHGFSGDIPARPGKNDVCVFAFNVGAGTNTSLGCRVVNY